MTYDKFVERIRMTMGPDRQDPRPFFVIEKKKYYVSLSMNGEVTLTEYNIPSTGTSHFYWDESMGSNEEFHNCMTFRQWYNDVIKEEHFPILEKFIFELTM